MSRIAYVNGRYLPQRAAAVNIEDRGYQFGDGVYEVVHLHDGRFIDEDRHLDAAGPLAARDCACAMPMCARGAAPRAGRGGAAQPGARGPALHAGDARRGAARPRLPAAADAARAGGDDPAHPALSARRRRAGRGPRSPSRTSAGRAATSRRVNLLPNVLARQAAREQGAIEAILVDARGHGDRGRRDQLLDRGRGTACCARAISTTPSCPAARARRCSTLLAEAGIACEERAFSVEEMRRGARGVHHQRHQLREADRAHRRRAGRRRAGRAGDAAAVRHLRPPRAGRRCATPPDALAHIAPHPVTARSNATKQSQARRTVPRAWIADAGQAAGSRRTVLAMGIS